MQDFQADPIDLAELFRDEDIPSSTDGPLPLDQQQQQHTYPELYGQQYDLSVSQGDPYQQGYGQRYGMSEVVGGESLDDQEVYGDQPADGSRGWGQQEDDVFPQQQDDGFTNQQQQQQHPYPQIDYQTPGPIGDVPSPPRYTDFSTPVVAEKDFSQKAPRKAAKKVPKKIGPVGDDFDLSDDYKPSKVAKNRVSKSTRKKEKKEKNKKKKKKTARYSSSSSSLDDFEPTSTQNPPPKTNPSRKAAPPLPPDPTDYTPITHLPPTPTASIHTPTAPHIHFLTLHLPWTILRLATVCVALCRMSRARDAESLAQFAVDLFGGELWGIAVGHYVKAREGDELEGMKACLADCIGVLKGEGEWGVGVARGLQERVVEGGLWWGRGEV